MSTRRDCLAVLAGALLGAGLARAAAPVRLAAVFRRSGPMAANIDALQTFRSARLAVDQLNAAGGLLGRPLELLELDSRSTTAGARAAAQTAIAQGCLAVIGENLSGLSLDMAPLLQQAGVIMLAPLASHPALTRVGSSVFRLCVDDDVQARQLARFAHSHLGMRRVAVLRNVSQKHSEELADGFERYVRRLGGNILAEESYEQDATDLSTQLKRIAVRRPDALFLSGYASDSAVLLRQARKLGLDQPYIGSDGLAERIVPMAGAAAANGYFLAHWQRDPADPRLQEFEARYAKAYGPIVAGVTEVFCYDAVQLLADAVRRAASLDRARVVGALAATKGWVGVTGSLSFDAERDARRHVHFVRVDTGGEHPVLTVSA